MPMWIVYLAVPLGSYLMCFRFLQVMVAFIAPASCPSMTTPTSKAWTTKSAEEARSQGMNAAIIFVLLLGLMLTGMPISISLGLTVLTFLFTMTQVPIESVALKLFTGIEKFEIMAIPFFILAGNFLTHGGVARRMINFASSMVGHWHGGLALAGVLACALFAAVSGSSRRRWWRSARSSCRPWCAGLSEALRRRRDHDLGRARHPDPAVDRDGDVFGHHQHLGRQAVHGRRGAGPAAGLPAGPDHLVPGAQAQLPAHAKASWGERWSTFRKAPGACS
jgi:hypothetical protein